MLHIQQQEEDREAILALFEIYDMDQNGYLKSHQLRFLEFSPTTLKIQISTSMVIQGRKLDIHSVDIDMTINRMYLDSELIRINDSSF